jgi:aspartyl-tRNA(Asn)/glutamyl-tRNA(Gln) amidotransferase subunit A
MSANPTELRHLSATELLEGYATRSFSPVEVAESVFDAIDAHNDRLRYFLAVNRDDGMAAAHAAERAWAAGDAPPLCGVPVSVKDSIEMAGMPTTYGSRAFADNVQPDSAIVNRLRGAGAVIVGKTNLPEFALSPETANLLGDPARNPWDNSRSAGGSSGGAGGSVAAGLAPIAIGTDSGGSIRCPGAYNGVFGIKPTYQRIPAVQRWRAAPGRSHNGPLTRTVADSALLMRVIGGPHPLDPETQSPIPDWDAWDAGPISMRGRKVALVASRSDELHGGFIAHLSKEATEFLEGLGAEVVEATLPPWDLFPIDGGALPYSADHYAAADYLRPGFWDAHADDLSPFIRPIYDAGRHVLAWQYRQAVRHDQEFRERMTQWFIDSNIDFIVMQATGVAPELCKVEDGIRPPSLTDLVQFNMSRNPAASVPYGFHAETGLPVAVQVIGRRGDDLGVLQVSSLLEEAKPWAHRWPSQGVD